MCPITKWYVYISNKMGTCGLPDKATILAHSIVANLDEILANINNCTEMILLFLHFLPILLNSLVGKFTPVAMYVSFRIIFAR